MAKRFVRKMALPAALIAAAAVLLGVGALLSRRPVTSATELGVRVPTISPRPGAYQRDIRVTLRPTHRRGQIVFTTDGTLPTAEVGTLYVRPLRLDAASPKVVVIRAVEVVDGVPGPVISVTYVLGLEGDLPVVSLSIEPADLWDAERGILANPAWRGAAWERPVHVDYIAPDDEFAISGGLRVHGMEPPDADKQSLRLYFRSEYGMSRLSFPLFDDHPYQPDSNQSYKRLLLQAGDKSGRWTFFRDQLVADVATDLGLHATQGRFVHLFVNGESWGLYRLSERIERFFLEENLGIPNADLVQDGRQREGFDDDWDALADWVVGHNLSKPEHFAYVAAQVDVDNLTDWAVLQLYFGFPAEELYAARGLDGRWFFLYEGGSQAFALSPESSLTTLHSTADADFAVLLRALLENSAYRERFARRLTVLLNTKLYRTSVWIRAMELTGILQEDIAYEEARWPMSFEWRNGVDVFLAHFTYDRPREVFQQVTDVLGVGEVARFRVDLSPNPLSGRVYLAGVPLFIDSDPWEGYVLSEVPIELTGIPASNKNFAGWTVINGEEFVSTDKAFVVAESRHIIAEFEQLTDDDVTLQPDDVVISELWINDSGTHYASVGNRPIEGDWIELRVRRDDVDLRRWRLTDNDTITSTAEGSLIFPNVDALAAVPKNTIVLVLATETEGNALNFPADDVNVRDKRLIFYVGNGNLDVTTDPGFGLNVGDDNLALLAPSPGDGFADDVADAGLAGVGVDFVAEGHRVTPHTFGILTHGVTFDAPFRQLSDDDGAVFIGGGSNDMLDNWLVDPPAYQSGDELRVDSPNIVTPGRRNLAPVLLRP